MDTRVGNSEKIRVATTLQQEKDLPTKNDSLPSNPNLPSRNARSLSPAKFVSRQEDGTLAVKEYPVIKMIGDAKILSDMELSKHPPTKNPSKNKF